MHTEDQIAAEKLAIQDRLKEAAKFLGYPPSVTREIMRDRWVDYIYDLVDTPSPVAYAIGLVIANVAEQAVQNVEQTNQEVAADLESIDRYRAEKCDAEERFIANHPTLTHLLG